MAINKVVYGGNTLIDLTADTITPANLDSGVTAHDKSGATIVGTSTRDSDTSDANVSAGEILSGKTAYARGAKITGTMPNNGAVDIDITTRDQTVTVPQGYHDGSGTVQIGDTERAKIIANNIREGVEVLGITGTLSPASDVTSQTKSATPYTTPQTILPDPNIDYLSQVDIAAIAYVETDNSAGGKTATIGTVDPNA